MSKEIKAGATDQSVYFHLRKASDGTDFTGLVYNTAGLKGYYNLNRGSSVQITLATLAAANSAHSDGGFKEVDATNMPGVYRLDLPDAAVATGPDVRVTITGVTDLLSETKEIPLVAFNPEDGVRLGLTSLPNAAAEASGGLFTRGTGAGQINQAANGEIDVNAIKISGDATAADNAEAFFDGTGYAGTNNVIPTVTTLTNLPAITTGWLTATGIAADAITATKLAADVTTELQSGLATAASIAALNNLSAAQVNTEVLDVLTVDTFAEPSSVPAATSTLKDKINWLFSLARNKGTQTSTTKTLRNDADSADIGTSTISDDGTTFTRGEWV